MSNAFTLMRLSQAPDLDALRRVWESLGEDQKLDPIVRQYKDTFKAQLAKVAS